MNEHKKTALAGGFLNLFDRDDGVAHFAAGGFEGEGVPCLAADHGLAERRFVGDLALRHVCLFGADDMIALLFAGAGLFDDDDGAHIHNVGGWLLGDDDSGLQETLERRDALFDAGLGLARLLVLGILREVAERFGVLKTLRDLATAAMF